MIIDSAWNAGSFILDPCWGLICTGEDVANRTGKRFFAEDDDARDKQAYVKKHSADSLPSFVVWGFEMKVP